MAALSAVRAYEALKSHLGEEDARLFIEYIEEATREARGELATKADLAEVKADLIKWMFLFWIGQVAVLFGLMRFMLVPA